MFRKLFLLFASILFTFSLNSTCPRQIYYLERKGWIEVPQSNGDYYYHNVVTRDNVEKQILQ